MKVEIWSDVVCPFCYIGKRNFEKALDQFVDKDKIEIEWKSYQLDPDYVYNPEKPETEINYLSEQKGISHQETVDLLTHVTNMALKAGLNYNFDKAIVANTFNAHKIIQLAKKRGLGNKAEERFFKAFFLLGENINEIPTLEKIGAEIGLSTEEINKALSSDDTYAYEVNNDIREARQIGVRGVPFFVFDRKYAVSGAQPVDTFSQTIAKSFDEWKQKNQITPITNIAEGSSCDIDGDCK
ncbi:MAG: DsbA family oxidoreductase [Paludibacteraceae bacterium]